MFLYSHWLSLSLPTRIKIAHEFGVAKRGPTHVDSNRIVSDGYDIKEVESAISLQRMQEYLRTDEADFDALWNRLIDVAEGRMEEPKNLLETGLGIEPRDDSKSLDEAIKSQEMEVEKPTHILIYNDLVNLETKEIEKPKRGRPKKIK